MLTVGSRRRTRWGFQAGGRARARLGVFMAEAVSTPNREFARDIQALAEVFGFLDESFRNSSIDDRSRLILQLAVEELFTNMVKYNSQSPSQIQVRIVAADDRIEVQLVDPDSDPFDPLQHPPVDTTTSIEKRRRGGLGIHLVRTMADNVDYHYQGREMTISVTKRLE